VVESSGLVLGRCPLRDWPCPSNGDGEGRTPLVRPVPILSSAASAPMSIVISSVLLPISHRRFSEPATVPASNRLDTSQSDFWAMSLSASRLSMRKVVPPNLGLPNLRVSLPPPCHPCESQPAWGFADIAWAEMDIRCFEHREQPRVWCGCPNVVLLGRPIGAMPIPLSGQSMG